MMANNNDVPGLSKPPISYNKQFAKLKNTSDEIIAATEKRCLKSSDLLDTPRISSSIG